MTTKDEDIIDLEEINGVYVPTAKTTTNSQNDSKQNHSNRRQHNVRQRPIRNTHYDSYNHSVHSPVYDFEQLIDGFNTGVKLVNKFIKLIK